MLGHLTLMLMEKKRWIHYSVSFGSPPLPSVIMKYPITLIPSQFFEFEQQYTKFPPGSCCSSDARFEEAL